MGHLVMIIQFLLGLSIIVGLHELGHLLFAKLFGMRVESYSIGFPPKLLRFRWGHTEYAIGAIPLGGAVKITGMIDESLDTANLTSKPLPWEFRAKPAWQRLVVICGGICFNIISSMIIYATLIFLLGDTYLTKTEVNKHGIVPSAIGKSLGFREGDRVVNINGKDFEKFTDVLKPHVFLVADSYYTVLRANRMVRIDMPVDLIDQLTASQGQEAFIAPRVPFVVGNVQQQSGAARAGLQPDDQLIEVAGKPISYLHHLKDILAENAGKVVRVRYVRTGVTHATTALISEQGKLGFQPKLLLAYAKESYSIHQAALRGVVTALKVMQTNFMAFGKILTGQLSPAKSLSGPIGMVQVFAQTFDWVQFWNIVGFLSLALAFTNLLPIPALDGGHALWIVYELITGRRLSDSFLQTAQKIGMAILICLIGYAIVNDLCHLL